jgi:hypothetical protein
MAWSGLIRLRRGKVAGCFKRGNKSSGFIKRRVFLDKLWNYMLLKKDSAPWR